MREIKIEKIKECEQRTFYKENVDVYIMELQRKVNKLIDAVNLLTQKTD